MVQLFFIVTNSHRTLGYFNFNLGRPNLMFIGGGFTDWWTHIEIELFQEGTVSWSAEV